jgi:2,3,4,5-tetrahydropyridine-2-carboxylate N-succinyltransferase
MNIFPVIAVGTCTTSLGGEILDVRYELIQFKDEPKEFPPTDVGHLSYFHFDNTLEHYKECKNFSEEEMKDWYWRHLDDGSIIDHKGPEKPDNYMEGKVCIINLIEKDEPVRSIEDAYLKLYLLSLKYTKPNSLNLDGLFDALPNIAWTNNGPMDPHELVNADEGEISVKPQKNTYIRSLDKFPCLTDYIVPSGVRIADASRVRLGAYLSEGTTVMHEGFVNFNAGTLGPAMIEGRISAGVVIGANSDLGGGCSTMGTLSGGNNVKISVGEDCLLGANSGLGIPLGDRCIVEAGLYLTGGSKVEVLDKDNKLISTVKASELSLQSDLLFIRNSLTGAVQCRPNKKSVVLNEQLHNND